MAPVLHVCTSLTILVARSRNSSEYIFGATTTFIVFV